VPKSKKRGTRAKRAPRAESPDALLRALDEAILSLAKRRGRPLLVLYWDASDGAIVDSDPRLIHRELRKRGWSRDSPKESLDVLLHTTGGDPDAAYRTAQVLRDFSEEVTFLVPDFAWSAGTLLALSGDSIVLGAHARLGPIDVTVGPDDAPGIPLAGIEYFRRWVGECQHEMLHAHDCGEAHAQPANVASDLLVEMTKQVGAIRVGEYRRMSELTRHYARRLLEDYMFRGKADAEEMAEVISGRLLREYPSHGFTLDYHMCEELGLCVEEADDALSDCMATVVGSLIRAVSAGVACPDLSSRKGGALKDPYVQLKLPRGRG
jgi:hypothetical protein